VYVLRKPGVAPGLIKSPKTQRLPDIVTVEEAQRLFAENSRNARKLVSC
jgi:integrase/recombinase XerD